MNEKIGVIIDFLTPAYEKTLRNTAARCVYDIVFFALVSWARRCV